MGIFEIIGKLILGIGLLIAAGYLWGIFTDWFSKVMNSNISYHGEIVSRPDNHDQNMEDIKRVKSKIVSEAIAIIDSIEPTSVKKRSTEDLIHSLSELEELKNSNAITEKQYETLKSKLLKTL